jgi:hypothetical protein
VFESVKYEIIIGGIKMRRVIGDMLSLYEKQAFHEVYNNIHGHGNGNKYIPEIFVVVERENSTSSVNRNG